MWKLDFKVSGLTADDGERRQRRENDNPRNRNAIWLIGGFVLAYLFGVGSQSSSGVAIVSPTNGTSTFEAQADILGTLTGLQGGLVTLRVNDTTQTAPVTNGIFQSQVNLVLGRNDIRASSGDLESAPITIIRKARPVLRINLPVAGLITQDPEVEVRGTAENLEADSINIDVDEKNSQTVPAAGGRFATRVKLEVGTNNIRALTSGSDPVVVVVVRTEAGKPAIAITTPASGFTTVIDSVRISGTVVNSDAAEITLSLNKFPIKVSVKAGQFEDTVYLIGGPNEIQASLGDVVSDVVIVNRKLPPKIAIARALQDYNAFARPSIANVRITGTVENLDIYGVLLSVNNTPQGRATVRDGKFEYAFQLKAGASYTVHASANGVVSNLLTIDVPSDQTTNPSGPGSPVTPEECARILCDCDNVRVPVPGVAQPGVADRISLKALMYQCRLKQEELRKRCLETHQWPGPCPPKTSGPNPWPSPRLPKKGQAALKSDQGVKQP